MIKGSIRPYDFRFDTDFNDFLNSVKRASVTYKVDHVTVDGKIEDSPDIGFNFQRTPEKYAENLEKDFNASCNEIENQLDGTYLKSEKLYQLSMYIIEIRSIQKLLTQNPHGFVHKNFSFLNISKEEKYKTVTLCQNDFQEYYYWMDYYLQKMQDFLTHMKSLTEIIPQSEFKIPSSMLPDPNGSSVERPFAFFEYLLLCNGITDLRRAFIPSEDDYNFGSPRQYDKKTETITYYDHNPITGEEEISTSSFEKVLLNRIYKEFIETRRLIEAYVNTLRSEQDIKLFFLRTMSSLRYFLKVIETNKDLKKYNSNVLSIKGLIRYCYDRYGTFCPEEDKELKAELSKTQAQQIQQGIPLKHRLNSSDGLRVFSLNKGNLQAFSLILHKHLSDACLISKDTEIQTFSKAFDGTVQQLPLKIKWIDKGLNGKPNKHTLFYLLNKLAANDIIQEDGDNKLFLQRIAFVFADEKGAAFCNLKVSNATASKPSKTLTPSKKIIEEAILELKNVWSSLG